MKPALVLSLLGAACAQPLLLPMTASDLARHPSGEALLVYLGQRGASPAVCDLGSPAPHIAGVNREVADALREGLVTRRIAPALWRGCVDQLLASAYPDQKATIMDAAAAAYGDLLGDGRIERARVFEAPLAAVHDLLVERPPGIGPHVAGDAKLEVDLRRALADDGTGPIARRYASALLAARELERGRLRGRAVDLTLLDELQAAGELGQLRRCAARLPDPGLRLAARRRAIRLGLQRSPFPEVRADAEAVERVLMAQGMNRLSATAQAPDGAWIEGSALAAVAVAQVPAERAARLRPHGDRSGLRLLPPLPLRGALRVQMPGLSRPVTTCGPPEALDPTPCLALADLGLESGVAHLDRDGAVQVADRISDSQAVALARASDRLLLPITLGGRPLVTLEAPLRFERPADLVMSDGTDGRGPDLHVRAELVAGGRLLYTVTSGGRTRRLVVEPQDAGSFRVVSRGPQGAAGLPGSSGADGSDGTSGWSASCPLSSGGDGSAGGNGSDGGKGGDGGPGGDGGDILVEAVCGGASCDTLLPLIRSHVRSEGGAGGDGGSGGSGGRGGRGGDGGSGTTCTDLDGNTTSLSGGSAGSSGRDGWSGSSGTAGPPGRPGRLRVVVLP